MQTKMPSCISAKTSTLVFAILNIILVTASFVGSGGYLFLWAIYTFHGPIHMEAIVIPTFLIMGWMTLSLLGLVFSSFLLNGILKKNPHHMKAYFIYGIIMMVISVCAVFVVTLIFEPQVDILMPAISVFVIYSLVLHLIRYTYTQFEIELDQFSHHKLIENDKC